MTRRKLNVQTFALWAALPMARTAQVESRLQMILKPNASRRALTRRAALVSLAAAALGVGTLAGLRPAVQAQNEAAAVSPTSWKQTLPNGATVEVLGVSDVPPYQEGAWRKDDPPPRRGWWQPNGSPLAAAPIDSDKQMTPVGTKDMAAWRQFAVRVSPPPGAAASSIGTTFDLSRTSNMGSSSELASRQGRPVPNTWLVGARFGDLQKQPILRCGVAAGPWETLRTKSAYEGFEMTSTAPYFFPYGENYGEDTPSHGHGQVVFSRASLVGGAAAITVTHVLPSDRAQARVVAVDLNGKVFTDNDDDLGSMAVGDTNQATYVFKGLPLSRVRAFRFQARLYQWAEFTGIALKPGRDRVGQFAGTKRTIKCSCALISSSTSVSRS